MKKSIMWVAVAFGLAQGMAFADQIVEAQPDRLVGGGFGGLSGFMVGAAGGPLGALAGGGLGYFLGQGVQSATGLEHRLYRLKGVDGSLSQVRSPTLGLQVGQQVSRDGNRLTLVQP